MQSYITVIEQTDDVETLDKVWCQASRNPDIFFPELMEIWVKYLERYNLIK